MVSENYNAQLKWFAKKLIKIRISSATDGYDEPIDFDPAIVMNCTNPDFDTANRTPEQHIERMLKAIRSALTRFEEVRSAEINELKWIKLENGHIEIGGFTTALLRRYLKVVFNETHYLFGEAHDERGRTVLAYDGRPTSVLLSGKQLSVFRCLLRNFGKRVSFEELHEAIRSQENITRGQSSRRTESVPATEAEKEVVCTAVNTLKRKLDEASGHMYREIIESIYGEGYTMTI